MVCGYSKLVLQHSWRETAEMWWLSSWCQVYFWQRWGVIIYFFYYCVILGPTVCAYSELVLQHNWRETAETWWLSGCFKLMSNLFLTKVRRDHLFILLLCNTRAMHGYSELVLQHNWMAKTWSLSSCFKMLIMSSSFLMKVRSDHSFVLFILCNTRATCLCKLVLQHNWRETAEMWWSSWY